MAEVVGFLIKHEVYSAASDGYQKMSDAVSEVDCGAADAYVKNAQKQARDARKAMATAQAIVATNRERHGLPAMEDWTKDSAEYRAGLVEYHLQEVCDNIDAIYEPVLEAGDLDEFRRRRSLCALACARAAPQPLSQLTCCRCVSCAQQPLGGGFDAARPPLQPRWQLRSLTRRYRGGSRLQWPRAPLTMLSRQVRALHERLKCDQNEAALVATLRTLRADPLQLDDFKPSEAGDAQGSRADAFRAAIASRGAVVEGAQSRSLALARLKKTLYEQSVAFSRVQLDKLCRALVWDAARVEKVLDAAVESMGQLAASGVDIPAVESDVMRGMVSALVLEKERQRKALRQAEVARDFFLQRNWAAKVTRTQHAEYSARVKAALVDLQLQ